jgi:hypothetical protein
VKIIEGHDSRKEAMSLNDKLVKDADKLWRFSAVGMDINEKLFQKGSEEHLDLLVPRIDEWFFMPESKDMAREALNEAKNRVHKEP